ncbi:MAG: hypothetical protein GY705_10065 [Bacteroidetes bacterium]|nr:hypothetical protein [Bacteroidota bacterium]
MITGETNDNEVIIEYGLEGKDEIYLTIPSDPNDLELIYLPKDLKKSIKDKQEEEKKMRQAQALEKAKKVKDEQIPQQSGRGGSFIIIE